MFSGGVGTRLVPVISVCASACLARLKIAKNDPKNTHMPKSGRVLFSLSVHAPHFDLAGWAFYGMFVIKIARDPGQYARP